MWRAAPAGAAFQARKFGKLTITSRPTRKNLAPGMPSVVVHCRRVGDRIKLLEGLVGGRAKAADREVSTAAR